MRTADENLSCRTLIDTIRSRFLVFLCDSGALYEFSENLLSYFRNVLQNCDSNETAQSQCVVISYIGLHCVVVISETVGLCVV